MSVRTETDIDNIKDGYKEFVEQANFENIEERMSPDFVGHYAGFPEVRGIEAFKQFVLMWTAAFSDRRITFDDVLQEGDRIALRTTFEGTHSGELNGIPPTGKRISISGMDIFRVEGDKAVEQWSVNDNMGMMQQLGVIPAQG